MIRLLSLTLLFISCVQAGTLDFGSTCNQGENRLQAGTYQFWSECDSQTYCASNSTCAHRGCRKDEFPFGYSPTDHLPEKCPKGQFCPDEEDNCQDILPVGSPCQLNRDGETQVSYMSKPPCCSCLCLSLRSMRSPSQLQGTR